MIRFNKKLAATLGAVAIVGSGVFAATPAQAAMSCQSVPGSTIGADVKVGPVTQRVPAISGIQICVGTGTAPVASVTFSGGTCTSNCMTVTVGGGDVDLEGMSVSWREDGVLRTQAVNPAPVDGPDGMCVISVGMPDAPNPNCFIAIGPDDPSGIITPLMNTINDVIDLGLETVNTAYAITCSVIPDRSGYDFCTDPSGWTNATTDYAYNTACARVPDQYDQWGNRYDFCTDPIGWTNAVIGNAYQTGCDRIPPMYRGYPYYSYVYFCDDPVGWVAAALGTDSWCISCNIVDLDAYLEAVRRLVNENIQINAG